MVTEKSETTVTFFLLSLSIISMLSRQLYEQISTQIRVLFHSRDFSAWCGQMSTKTNGYGTAFIGVGVLFFFPSPYNNIHICIRVLAVLVLVIINVIRFCFYSYVCFMIP